jgi:lysophospholipase L1-like esterase
MFNLPRSAPSAAIFVLTLLPALAADATSTTAAAPPHDPALPTVWIAGDSTAAPGGPASVGWGVPFAAYFDRTKVNVANRARGGRSSRTFITDGSWQKLVESVKPGDLVLIQFGHNDGGAINAEPPGSTRPLRARGSLPGLGDESDALDNVVTKQPEVVHTFGHYIRKMIAETQAKSATPIVLSLTIRNSWNDGKVERGSGKYGAWSATIAKTAGVHFIDLSKLIADAYEQRGQEAVKAFFPTATDETHTGAVGADFNAARLIAGLRALPGAPLDKFLSEKGRAVAPAK